MKKIVLSCLLVTTFLGSKGQSPLVVVEVESGKIGTDWEVKSNLGLEYITSKTDVQNADYPAAPNKIITYTINFPKEGTYDLFVKVRVGSNGPNDDSFFYGSGFGEKSINNAEDWIAVNALAYSGYSISDINSNVDDKGNAKKGEWKWLNVSNFISLERGVNFKVKEGKLTQIFQIGGREDGLDIDKFVFAPVKNNYSVEFLNKAN